MAEGWTKQVAAAAGMAAATGAAQLGLGYGLGVVVWSETGTADESVWLGSLGWATWITASSTVFGAMTASRFRARSGGPWRFALAASAALGALLPVALIALPARAAVRPDTFSPETVAAGDAVIGVLLGLAIAYWAVVSSPVAANLVATAAWLWALAATAIVVAPILHRPSATYLTSWQFADSDNSARYATIHWPSALLTLLAALVIGVIGAWPAVRGGDLGVGAASSGAVGPLLVAAAFLTLAPQLTDASGPLGSAYLVAPYAVLAGLAGSALTVALGQRAADGRRRRATAQRSGTVTGVATVQAPARAAVSAKPAIQLGPASARPATRPKPASAKPARSEPAPAGQVTPPGPAAPSRPAAAIPESVGAGATGDAKPDASGAAGRSRGGSTVAPPPASPPVAEINSSRPDESTSAAPNTTAPRQAVTRSGKAATSTPAGQTAPGLGAADQSSTGAAPAPDAAPETDREPANDTGSARTTRAKRRRPNR